MKYIYHLSTSEENTLVLAELDLYFRPNENKSWLNSRRIDLPFPERSFSMPLISLCLCPKAETPICFRSSCPISARISTLICSRSNTSRSCSRPRLARKALMLMFKLVSGVTISVLLKSDEPSPGGGKGKLAPMPAGQGFDAEGGLEPAAEAKTAGARGNVVPEGMTTVSVQPAGGPNEA